MVARRALALVCLLAACGQSSGQKTSHAATRDDARPLAADAAAPPAELAEQPLGVPELAAYRWRAGSGQAAFLEASRAERAGDWAAVVRACREALAADPGHLEAAWSLAVALGRLGQPTEVLAPLQRAVAGDFGTWGEASLTRPALRDFLATPAGEAWTRRVEQDRARYASALARSIVVHARGDLYAYDPATTRWLRLTDTGGAVLGALVVAEARTLAYVVRGASAKAPRELAVGVLELARGRAIRPIPLGTAGPIRVAGPADQEDARHGAAAPTAIRIGSGTTKLAWRRIEDGGRLRALPARTRPPRGRWLEVAEDGAVRLHALPVPTVTADWDDTGLASAMRIGSSRRVVSPPSPGLIDGHTVTWSPGKTHLAFVAQLDDTCAPGAIHAAAYIADAATGTLTELARASDGLAIEWVTDRTLAIADGRGVSIRDLDGAPTTLHPDATELTTPRRRPPCAASPEPAAIPRDGDGVEAPRRSVEPSDAEVVGPP